MRLYGREWKRRELEARLGRVEQLAGVRRLHHTEGIEEGTELIQVRTGSGLSYSVTAQSGQLGEDVHLVMVRSRN